MFRACESYLILQTKWRIPKHNSYLWYIMWVRLKTKKVNRCVLFSFFSFVLTRIKRVIHMQNKTPISLLSFPYLIYSSKTFLKNTESCHTTRKPWFLPWITTARFHKIQCFSNRAGTLLATNIDIVRTLI